MSLRVRTFENTDTGFLAAIWQQHHLLAGVSSSCPSTVWDFCVLSKPFFEPEQFWIAFRDETPVGFLHAGFGPNSSMTDLDPKVGLISSFCVIQDPDEDRIAKRLLDECFSFFKKSNAESVLALGSPASYSFYLSVPPNDGLLGVRAGDLRLQNWLRLGGMQAWLPTSRWEIDMASFRPPMDRTQIQVRRQCQVSRVLDGQSLPWWIASAFGHAEQLFFQLSARSPLAAQLDVTFWQPDSTIPGLDSSGYLMQMNKVDADNESRDRLVFLLSESLRQLQQDRIDRVRTIVSSEDIQATHVLQRLGFRCTDNGVVFRSQLD